VTELVGTPEAAVTRREGGDVVPLHTASYRDIPAPAFEFLINLNHDSL
jgi:hypothetical protein